MITPLRESRLWRLTGQLCAGLAILCILIVTVAMLRAFIHDKQHGPLVTREVLDAKTKLRQTPDDDSLKTTLRAADVRVRNAFFDHVSLRQRGAWLLLGSGIVLVLSLKLIRLADKRPPALPTPTIASTQTPWAVLIVAAATVALFAAGALASRSLTTAASLLPDDRAAITLAWPTDQDLRTNWPVFRGWGGGGHVTGNYAHTFDEKSTAWRTPVPLPGKGSPIIWADTIFLTGADEDRRALHAFDLATGQPRWTLDVPATMAEGIEHFEDTGWAAPTPATDGTHIYAIFATGDLVAVDFHGKKIWQRFLGKPVSAYGYASSLTLYRGNVIVQWDVGRSESNASSCILAFDGATGRQVWRTPRPVSASWASPIVTAQGQLLAVGTPWVAGYDAATGAEHWRAKLMGPDIGASPIALADRAFIANEHALLAAINTSARGDLTDSAILWRSDEGLPDIASPITDGKRLWTITSTGTLCAFNATTGTKLYEHDLKRAVHASPVLVGDTLWLTDIRGITHIVRAGDTFEKLAETPALGPVSASLAFAQGRIIVRTDRHLVCIMPKGGGQ